MLTDRPVGFLGLKRLRVKYDKRKKILETALRIFADKGYHSTSVGEIARRSRISKGGLYFYFSSKEDLFLTLIDELGSSIIERIESKISELDSASEKLDTIFEEVLTLFTRYGSIARFILIESCVANPVIEEERQKIIDRLESIVAECIREGQSAGQIREEIEPDIAASALAGAVYHLVISGLAKGNLDELYRRREALKDFLFGNLFKGGIE